MITIKIKTVIIIIIVISLLGLGSLGGVVMPLLHENANNQVKQFIQIVINHVAFTNEYEKKELINIKYNSNKHVSMIDFNMQNINTVCSDYVNEIEEVMFSIEDGTFDHKDSIYNNKLKKISQSGIIGKVSIGSMSDNAFLSNLGPSFKVKYQALSKVSSSINKQIKNYGINYMSINIDLLVDIELLYQLPLNKGSYKHTYNIPLLFEIIEGQVPNWYTK